MTTHSLRGAALHTDQNYHLLDHIAPLAHLLNIPLITTTQKNFELTEYYYPQVHVEYDEDLEFRLASLTERFDALFECKYWAPQLKSLFKNLYNKEMKLIFCPHGQSDKGFNTPLLAPYANQDAVLLYGNLLIQMLKETNVWPSISNYAIVGNYRLNYYLQNNQLMDDFAEKKIFSHLPKQPTLLYAPTWQDADQSSSFFNETKRLFRELPSNWNLLIKPHPRLEEKNPAHFYALSQLTHHKKNALIITDFPPVYPILSRSDAYLGDFSSVGYDFLYLRRPMFFFPHPTLCPGKLQTCGTVLKPEGPIFSQIEELMNDRFAEKQKELYELAFGEMRSEELTKETILELIGSLRATKSLCF